MTKNKIFIWNLCDFYVKDTKSFRYITIIKYSRCVAMHVTVLSLFFIEMWDLNVIELNSQVNSGMCQVSKK